jgi:hypothetical protein
VGSPAVGALRTSRYNQGDIRSFVLSWSVAPAGVKAAIETLHANTFGGALTMKWTPPGESDEIRVRFLPGTAGYTRSRTSAGVYAIGVGLVEAPEFRTPSQIT